MTSSHTKSVAAECMSNDMAFPALDTGYTPNGTIQLGLTKREYFAAKALQGFCANPAVFASNGVNGWMLVNCSEEDLAGYSLKIADTLIEALTDDEVTRDKA